MLNKTPQSARPLCGIFYPNSVAARYGALIRIKLFHKFVTHILQKAFFQTLASKLLPIKPVINSVKIVQ